MARNPTVCGRRFCNRCGRWRHIVDFAAHRRDSEGNLVSVSSECYACTRASSKETKADYRRRLQIAEYNRIWQEAQRRQKGILIREEWQKLNGRQFILGRTHCSICKCWRPVSDFPTQKRRGQPPKLASACYACIRSSQRQSYQKRRQDPARMALRREYDRIYKEAQRRRAGVPEREWGPECKRSQDPNNGVSVAVGPLREWLEVVITREVPDMGRGVGRNGIPAHRNGTDIEGLAYSLGISPRGLWRIRTGEMATVSLSIADRLLHNYAQPVRVNGFGPVEFLWDLWPELDAESPTDRAA